MIEFINYKGLLRCELLDLLINMLATNVEIPKCVVLCFTFTHLFLYSLPSSQDIFFSYSCRKFSKINCFIVNNMTTDSNWFLYRNFSVTGISSILNLSPDCLIFLAIWLNIIYVLYFVLPFSGLLLKENFHFLSWPCLASLPFLPCLIWLMSKKDISAFVLSVLCSLLHT